MKRRLQVFISSTYTDLLHERQAAVSAVLKAGHIPAGMELFTAGDRSQMDTIKQWIDDSDVYMLVLGGRYGSIEPTSGVSYTELEYDYAVEQRKPVFAVVITEAALEAKIKAGGSTVLEKDNPKELALFRKKVLSNISSFFDDPKDIKLCVHESLADFSSNRVLRGWVSADEVQDTKPLFEEIRKLAEENRELKETLSALEKRIAPASQNSAEKRKDSFDELSLVLRAIKIKVPAELANGEEITIDLYTFFYRNKERLVNGITNEVGASKENIFFFYSICPKLQVHGLVLSEKVPGVRYRRCAVSPLGQAFLAEAERRTLLATSRPSIAGQSTPEIRGATKANPETGELTSLRSRKARAKSASK